MNSDRKEKDGEKMATNASATGRRKGAAPGWASGLRQIYDPVLREPLPNQLKDLLAQLDPNDDCEGGDA